MAKEENTIIVGRTEINNQFIYPITGEDDKALRFMVFMDYVIPSYAEIKSMFDGVNDLFEGLKFETIGACESINRKPLALELEMVHFNRVISTGEVLAELDKNDLRPALYEELLAFAKDNPEEQNKYPIVALGSVGTVRYGHRGAAYIHNFRDSRVLNLGWFDGEWGAHYRFLSVRRYTKRSDHFSPSHFSPERRSSVNISKGTVKSAKTFVAFVDYATPLYAELCDRFDYVHYVWHPGVQFKAINNVCKMVSREPRNVTFELIQFSRAISTRHILIELEMLGLRPALYEELLAFAAAYPNEQRGKSIVALGSIRKYTIFDRYAVKISGSDDSRNIWLTSLGYGDWYTGFQFLAVRM